MKMTTRVAFDNMKYHRSRNILIGTAIILTTMLLFVVPTVGKGMVDLQFAAYQLPVIAKQATAIHILTHVPPPKLPFRNVLPAIYKMP